MSLQDKLDAQRQQLESAAPKEAVEVMHKATQQLAQSGILSRVKARGDTAPDFSLNNYSGQKIRLSEKLENGPVVLGFYRGGW
ncbi:MAG: hypothetical protein ACLFUY_04405 [Desulfobacterales bacterium]